MWTGGAGEDSAKTTPIPPRLARSHQGNTLQTRKDKTLLCVLWEHFPHLSHSGRIEDIRARAAETQGGRFLTSLRVKGGSSSITRLTHSINLITQT